MGCEGFKLTTAYRTRALDRSGFRRKCFGLIALIVCFLISANAKADSTCFGTTSNGRLENSCKLPASGENFTSYSTVLRVVGRTYVHCTVEEIVLNAYASLSKTHPDIIYVYGETGKTNGGSFKPHKTHQNGLSVDFMSPVVKTNGESVPLPTHALNRYGYDIDFTLAGEYKDLLLDYEALAAHIAALKAAASEAGVGIWRVLFDPKMQPALKKTKAWPEISDLTFSKRRSWVRHDDHFHIDFVIPCEPL